VTGATSLGRARRPPLHALGVAAALGVLVLAGGLVARGWSRPSGRAEVRTSSAAPAVTSAAAPFVTLTFESEPGGAEARLVSDGALLGVTPFRRAFPRRAGTVLVAVAHTGHETVRVEVSTAATRTVRVILATRTPQPRPARTAASRGVAPLGSEKTIDPFPR
jgi:hypothetical protein